MFPKGPNIPGRKKIADDMIIEAKKYHNIMDEPKKKKVKTTTVVKIAFAAMAIAIIIRTLVALILSK